MKKMIMLMALLAIVAVGVTACKKAGEGAAPAAPSEAPAEAPKEAPAEAPTH